MRTGRVVVGLVLLLAACASSPAGRAPARSASASRSSGATAIACPLHDSDFTRVDRLPTDPTSAVACTADQLPQKQLPDQPLHLDTARVLAGIIEHSPIAPATSSRRCTPGSSELAVVVRFRGGDPAAADLVQWANCPHVAFVGRTAYTVGGTIARFLSLLPVSQDSASPDLFGMALGAARAAARRAGDTLALVGSYLDPDTAPGSVLLQSAMGSELDVVVAVPDAPACRADQLAVRYLPGGAGTGNDFGTIELTDTSGQWCALRGSLRVGGEDATGRQVTQTAFASANLELSPAATGDGLAGSIALIAEYRDDPSAPNGLCQPHWVIPVTWRTTLPSGTLTVRNAHARAAGPPGTAGLITCRGEVQAQVEKPGD